MTDAAFFYSCGLRAFAITDTTGGRDQVVGLWTTLRTPSFLHFVSSVSLLVDHLGHSFNRAACTSRDWAKVAVEMWKQQQQPMFCLLPPPPPPPPNNTLVHPYHPPHARSTSIVTSLVQAFHSLSRALRCPLLHPSHDIWLCIIPLCLSFVSDASPREHTTATTFTPLRRPNVHLRIPSLDPCSPAGQGRRPAPHPRLTAFP